VKKAKLTALAKAARSGKKKAQPVRREQSGQAWRDFSTAPSIGTFLVFLESEMMLSRIHAMTRGAKMAFIGNRFHFDAPRPTHWMPLPEAP
jgi:hypothetical protein